MAMDVFFGQSDIQSHEKRKQLTKTKVIIRLTAGLCFELVIIKMKFPTSPTTATSAMISAVRANTKAYP